MTFDGAANVVARAQRGNPEAAGELYTRFHQNIYRYLYYRIGDLQTAEDLTSEVFLKMVRALPTYRLDGTPFEAWLFQIARNAAIDHFRRSSAHPVAYLDEDLNSLEPDVDSTVEMHLTCEGLADALGNLNENQRDVLLLRFIEGMPISATGSVLHKTDDAVKALQSKGLAALRKMLNKSEEHHD